MLQIGNLRVDGKTVASADSRHALVHNVHEAETQTALLISESEKEIRVFFSKADKDKTRTIEIGR